LRFYQIILYPIAKPTAFVLDRLQGPEGIRFLSEKALRELIRIHVDSKTTEIGNIEARGALNFLDIDDLPLTAKGEPLDPLSIIKLPAEGKRPIFPELTLDSSDKFLQGIVQHRLKRGEMITGRGLVD
jgi:metal transporter CNNM